MPAPAPGFHEDAGGAALALSRGGQSLGAVALARAERRLAGRALARAALVGALPHDTTPDVADEAYRAILDRLIFTEPSPEIISFRVSPRRPERADLLWRLALALDARCLIGEEGEDIRVDVLRGGMRARLALTLPVAPLRDLSSWIAAAAAAARPNARAPLVVFARDTADDARAIAAAVDARFAVASADEVRRRPRRFGRGLSPPAAGDENTYHFVGDVHGTVVFRTTCTISAPALQLLPPSVLARLSAPVGLITSVETDVSFRGRSIYPAALQWIAGWARGRGIRTLVLFVDRRNVASARGAAKAGFTPMGEIAPEAVR